MFLLRADHEAIGEGFAQLETNPSDFQDYKTVLEIITGVLSRCHQDFLESRAPSILIGDSEYAHLDLPADTRRHLTEGDGNNADTYIVEVSDMDHIRRITESSDNSHPDDDDDDDLLQQDPTQWDIFDDYHKFEKREQKIKEMRRKEAAKELQIIQEQKQIEVQLEVKNHTEEDLIKLQNRIKAQEEALSKKSDREERMNREMSILYEKLNGK